MLAVIHQSWQADLLDRRRRPGKDWVSHEIEVALKAHKALVPVLLDGADIPDPARLPSEIRDLAHHTVCHLRMAQPHDLTQLIDTVAAYLDGALT